jgi:hypothetical protein
MTIFKTYSETFPLPAQYSNPLFTNALHIYVHLVLNVLPPWLTARSLVNNHLYAPSRQSVGRLFAFPYSLASFIDKWRKDIYVLHVVA